MAQRDSNLEAIQLEKDALNKAEKAAAPTVVSGDSIATQNQGGTHYHGPVTMSTSLSAPPGGINYDALKDALPIN